MLHHGKPAIRGFFWVILLPFVDIAECNFYEFLFIRVYRGPRVGHYSGERIAVRRLSFRRIAVSHTLEVGDWRDGILGLVLPLICNIDQIGARAKCKYLGNFDSWRVAIDEPDFKLFLPWIQLVIGRIGAIQ